MKTKDNFLETAMDEDKRIARIQALHKKLKFDRIVCFATGFFTLATLIHDVLKNEPLSATFLCALITVAFSSAAFSNTASNLKLLLTISALQEWFLNAADL